MISFPSRVALCVALCVTVPGSMFSTAGRADSELPPLGHSGGFGEPDCRACHAMESPANDQPGHPDGSIQISGFAQTFAQDSRNLMQITLTHSGLQTAGFQVSVRRCDGNEDAGDFSDIDDRVVVTPPWAKSAPYAWHSKAGSHPQQELESTWLLFWFAPEEFSGGFAFSVAGVAGDGDGSVHGDASYRAYWESADCQWSKGDH